MKRRLLTLLILLPTVSSVMRADEQHSLIISFHEGDSVAIVLADKPCAAFKGDSLCVETSSFSTTYLRSTISGFHFGWYDPVSTSIDALLEGMAQIVYTDNSRIRVRGIGSSSIIYVYGLDGRRLSTSLIPEDDGISIDLTAYPAGIYFININNIQTFKITKQ